MHIAAVEQIVHHLLPAVARLRARSRQRRRRSRTSSRSGARTCRTRRRSRSGRRSPAGSRSSTMRARRSSRDAGRHELALGGTRSARASTRIPSTRCAARAEIAPHRPAVRDGAEQVRGARRPRGAGHAARRAQDAGRGAHEDRQRRPLAGVRSALRPRRDHDSRERARQLDHAGQGQPDAVRGDDDGRRRR